MLPSIKKLAQKCSSFKRDSVTSRQAIAFGLAVGLALSAAPQVIAQTAEEREFVERITGQKEKPEELLIWLVLLNDIEGNYSTYLKLEDLQRFYATHKALNVYREGWCAAKLAHYYLLKGMTDLAQKQTVRAQQYLKKMPDPLYMDSCFFYNEGLEALYPSLYKLNRPQEALKAKQELIAGEKYLGNTKARIYSCLAARALIHEDDDEAKGYCEEAMKVDPNYVLPLYIRAAVYHGNKQKERAKAELNKSLLIFPRFSSAYAFLGFCEFEQEHYQNALTQFNKATELGASAEHVLAMRGFAKTLVKDIPGAVADLSSVLRTEKDHWIIYAVRGECYLELRKYEEAVEDFNQALKYVDKYVRDKTKAILYYDRAWAYDGASKAEKAIADLDKAAELDPTNKEVFKQRGVLRLSLGDEKGVTDYDQCSKLILEEENTSIANKQGNSKVVVGSFVKKRNDDDPEKPQKPSWISEGAASSAKPSAESKSAEIAKDKTKEKEKNEDKKELATSEYKEKDAYLVYFENKLLQVRSVKPGAPTEKGVVRIEADGVPTLLDKTEKTQALYDLIMRAAPFKLPPDGKPNSVDVEYNRSEGTVSVKFHE